MPKKQKVSGRQIKRKQNTGKKGNKHNSRSPLVIDERDKQEGPVIVQPKYHKGKSSRGQKTKRKGVFDRTGLVNDGGGEKPIAAAEKDSTTEKPVPKEAELKKPVEFKVLSLDEIQKRKRRKDPEGSTQSADDQMQEGDRSSKIPEGQQSKTRTEASTTSKKAKGNIGNINTKPLISTRLGSVARREGESLTDALSRIQNEEARQAYFDPEDEQQLDYSETSPKLSPRRSSRIKSTNTTSEGYGSDDDGILGGLSLHVDEEEVEELFNVDDGPDHNKSSVNGEASLSGSAVEKYDLREDISKTKMSKRRRVDEPKSTPMDRYHDSSHLARHSPHRSDFKRSENSKLGSKNRERSRSRSPSPSRSPDFRPPATHKATSRSRSNASPKHEEEYPDTKHNGSFDRGDQDRNRDRSQRGRDIDRIDSERAVRDKVDRERVSRNRLTRDRPDRSRPDREQINQFRPDRDQIGRDRVDRDRVDRDRANRDRIDRTGHSERYDRSRPVQRHDNRALAGADIRSTRGHGISERDSRRYPDIGGADNTTLRMQDRRRNEDRRDIPDAPDRRRADRNKGRSNDHSDFYPPGSNRQLDTRETHEPRHRKKRSRKLDTFDIADSGREHNESKKLKASSHTQEEHQGKIGSHIVPEKMSDKETRENEIQKKDLPHDEVSDLSDEDDADWNFVDAFGDGLDESEDEVEPKVPEVTDAKQEKLEVNDNSNDQGGDKNSAVGIDDEEEVSVAGAASVKGNLVKDGASAAVHDDITAEDTSVTTSELQKLFQSDSELDEILRVLKNELESTSPAEVFTQVQTLVAAGVVPKEALRLIAQHSFSAVSASGLPFWEIAQQVYSKLVVADQAEPSDRFMLLKTMINAKQLRHTWGLLAAMRKSADGRNELHTVNSVTDQEQVASDYGNLIYPALCDIAVELQSEDLLADLLKCFLSDCMPPSPATASRLVYACIEMRGIAAVEDLCTFLSKSVEADVSLLGEAPFKILALVIDAEKYSVAMDIVHDLLMFDVGALNVPDSANKLAKLCHAASNLDSQYLDDTVDLFMFLSETFPSCVTNELLKAVLVACSQASSISRSFLVLRAATAASDVIQLSDVLSIGKLCQQQRDRRISQLLEVSNLMQVEDDSEIIAVVVDALADLGDWQGALSAADSMISGEVKQNIHTLGSLSHILACKSEWDHLDKVLKACFKFELLPSPEFMSVIGRKLAETGEFSRIRSIASETAKLKLPLSSDFFSSVFDILALTAKKDGISTTLETDLLLLFKDFKEHDPCMKQLKEKSNAWYESAERATNDVADVKRCPQHLAPFASVLKCFRIGKLFDYFYSVYAYVAECGLHSNDSFNCHFLEVISKHDIKLALNAFRAMCKAAEVTDTPRIELLGATGSIKFLNRVEKKLSDSGAIVKELLQSIGTLALAKHATKDSVNDVVDFLHHHEKHDSAAACVHKYPLSSVNYEKLLITVAKCGQPTQALEIIAASSKHKRKLSRKILLRAFKSFLDTKSTEGALALYKHVQEYSRGAAYANRIPLTEVKTLCRLLCDHGDPDEAQEAQVIFEERLKDDLGETIFAEAPWKLNLRDLTMVEMEWVLRQHLSKLATIEKMQELCLEVGDLKDAQAQLEKSCCDLLSVLDNNFSELLKSKKPALAYNSVVIERVDLENYFKKGTSVRPSDPIVPSLSPSLAINQDNIGHPRTDIATHSATSAGENDLNTILKLVEEAEGAELNPENADGIRRRNVRDKVALKVCSCLKPFYKAKKITTKEDFKHLSRKLSRQYLNGKSDTLRPSDISDDDIQTSVTKFFKKLKGEAYSSDSRIRKKESN